MAFCKKCGAELNEGAKFYKLVLPVVLVLIGVAIYLIICTI